MKAVIWDIAISLFLWTNLTRGKEPCSPGLNFLHPNIKAWAYDTTLVQSSIKFNYNLAWTVIINKLKLTDVPCSKKRNLKVILICEVKTVLIVHMEYIQSR